MHKDRPNIPTSHSLAVYPDSFKGCVVSKNKICLQFNSGQALLRANGEDLSDLRKSQDLNLGRELSVHTHAYKQFMTVAMGASINTHIQMWDALCDAYVKYVKEQDIQFKDDLLRLQAKINNMIDRIV